MDRAGPIARWMSDDHARLDALLRRAFATPGAVDLEAYAAFREGLLRHIAMEEKVLLPEARRRRGDPFPEAARLRTDHAALATLMVPPPSLQILEGIRRILEPHNEIEETEGGLYDAIDRLAGPEAEAFVERLRAMPRVPVQPHLDDERVRARVAVVLRERGL